MRSHTLRYVLRNKTTGDVYLALCFTIHPEQDVDEDGNIKEEAAPPVPAEDNEVKTSADDVD